VSAIADVARLAGVSKSTASRALSGHGYVSAPTRRKVETAAAEIGYVASSIASSLSTGHTRNVGIVIPFVNRWFFAEVLEGLESALIEAGYDLTLYRLHDDAEQRQRIFDYFLVRRRVDAVIAVGISLTRREVQSLRAIGKPIVGIGGDIPGISTISIDDRAATRFLTEHLLSLGHTRIMHIGGDQDEQMDFEVHAQRLDGVRMALAAAGFSHNEDFRAVPYSIPGGYAGGLAALADPVSRPTAIVAGCDEIAIGVMLAARELGISVPAQLSVVGVDGHSLADLFELTTLEQHPARQGQLAVGMILARLDDESGAPEVEHVTMPVDFVVRRSTTAPGHTAN
jgi:DNA-binding LacI/PurR family transcriptional regulator